MIKFRRLWSLFGPGILLAATSIGASHLVLSPRAGMLYGVDLLWLLLVAHLMKYHAFEFGPRYAMATGESLIAGYRRVPGPRNWALYVLLGGTVLQGVGVGVAVVSIAACVLEVGLGGLSVAWWGMIIATVILLLLWIGKYPGMDALNKLMMLTLVLVTLLALFSQPPPIGNFAHLFIPALPEGSLLLVAALLGWLPTGIDVSIWHSLWALESRGKWSAGLENAEGGLGRGVMKRSLLDMRLVSGLSFGLALVFFMLGTYLKGRYGAETDGAQVAVALSEAYQSTLGDWAFPLFMTVAFFGMFSTCYIVLDGFPRTLSETLKLLSDKRRQQKSFWAAPYWSYLLVVWIGVVLVLHLFPKPVFLVKSAALLSFLLAPLYYGLNYYCVTRFIKEPHFKPGPAARIMALAGIWFMVLASGLFIYMLIK